MPRSSITANYFRGRGGGGLPGVHALTFSPSSRKQQGLRGPGDDLLARLDALA